MPYLTAYLLEGLGELQPEPFFLVDFTPGAIYRILREVTMRLEDVNIGQLVQGRHPALTGMVVQVDRAKDTVTISSDTFNPGRQYKFYSEDLDLCPDAGLYDWKQSGDDYCRLLPNGRSRVLTRAALRGLVANGGAITQEELDKLWEALSGTPTLNTITGVPYEQVPYSDTHSCDDNMESYVGLLDTFRYCKICDKKVRD